MEVAVGTGVRVGVKVEVAKLVGCSWQCESVSRLQWVLPSVWQLPSP